MNITKNKKLIALIGAALALACPSFGELITLKFEGAASGELDYGLVTFANENFIISLTGDTSNRTSFGNGFSILPDFATVEIANVGLFEITSNTSVFVNNTYAGIGFGNDDFAVDIIDIFGPTEFSTYDLLSDLGPITVPDGYLSGFVPLYTTGGRLDFDTDVTQLTVTATTGLVAVPEPSTYGLMGALALVAIIGLRRSVSRKAS